ncbi:cellulose 1,4-beta-cellobiosidase [Streptomyces sp. Ru87]|nr:cellulose 1,4-beta-cellobiosidase [Streptomyces sp. Ru87]
MTERNPQVMRTHLRRRLRPGPVTGGLALAALVAGVVPGTTFATEADAPAKAPTVSLASQDRGGGNYVLADKSVPLKAETSGEVSKVEFYADNQLLATDAEAPFEGKWANAPEGQYSLTAKAYDAEGKPVSSHPSLVSVIEKPAVVASPVTAYVEQGAETTFDVSLTTKPASDVEVTIERASGNKDLSAKTSKLTFTPENWDKAQQVTVVSADKKGDAGLAKFEASAKGHETGTAPVQELGALASDYEQAFLDQYNKISDPSSGYYREFDGLKVPYHSIETLIVEAPDHGHETTSEAFTYYLWLESEYGRLTEDWGPFNDAWASLEKFAIPGTEDQPTNGAYDPSSPATYAPEHTHPSEYPAQLDGDVSVGEDPLAEELSSAYGSDEIYGMHWLLDVDNTYGFGFCGDESDAEPVFINTFQRGSQESVWETVTQPSCDTFAHGGENGYLDLFTGDENYSEQWKYTNAPDADARAVQVAYQAKEAAAAQGNGGEVADVVEKATKMGDYLRYAMFDKYFKAIGDCTSPSCPAGSGKDSAHYLMSWYYAWGGALESAEYPWAWRIGGSASHQGYQNPMAAWALAEDPDMQPQSSTGQEDWAESLDRQLEFLQWLQSSEGAIAGGATNSWEGDYGTPPSDASTFYGMYYDWQPVWNDPPSNRWFGFQVWGLQRTAELYAETGDERAGAIMDKWVDWALENSTIDGTGNYQIPSEMEWSGQPDDWSGSPSDNSNLHVEVTSHTNDVGVAASFAKTLLYYAAGSGDEEARLAGEGLLDGLLEHQDDLGIALEETRGDYERFVVESGDDKLYVPDGWTGTMPNGDEINSDSTFLSIRSFYESDPEWSKVQEYLDGGEEPTFTYHRYWAQAEIATAFSAHVALFGTE